MVADANRFARADIVAPSPRFLTPASWNRFDSMRSCTTAAFLVLMSAVWTSAGRRAGTAPLSLVCIGDWGGESDEKPSNAAQQAASAGMSKVSEEIGAQGILLLGDNFYLHGVESNTSVRFQETFEDVYPVEAFKNLPFYVIAGNHDHRGNVQAQIDYHGSARWHFPHLYYKLPFKFTSSTGVPRTVDFVLIDTVDLCGICEEEYVGCPLVGAAEDEVQWTWLEQQLQTSTADFLWVGGHYPIYSAGGDGTTPLLVQRLLPMLKKYGAHYISGHDHMHEHLVHEGVNMVVTGPGRMCCYNTTHFDTVPAGAIKFMVEGPSGHGPKSNLPQNDTMLSGFSSLQFDDTVTMTMYKEDGETLYTAPPIAARSKV